MYVLGGTFLTNPSAILLTYKMSADFKADFSLMKLA